MAKLSKRGYIWYITYADSTGRSRRLSTRTGIKRLARERLVAFEYNKTLPPEEKQQTISKLLKAYLDDRVDIVASYASLSFAADKIISRLGDHRPKHLTMIAIKKYRQARLEDGVKDGTIIKELKTLRAALSFGVKRGWLVVPPYIELPPQPAPKNRWLTKDEADKLIKAATAAHVKLFLILAIYTGARRGAILDLTWDRVSDDFKLINFILPGRPTSKKRRTLVPTTRLIQATLKEAAELAQTNWVIEYNEKPSKTMRTGFKNALLKSKIDHCTIHDLRRTCATWLIQGGVSLSRVARMLGDSEKMIEKVYGHHAPDYLDDAISVLEG